MTTDHLPRPRDAKGRFIPTRDAAQGRSLVVLPEVEQDAPLMVSTDPDDRHLFLNFVVFGVAAVSLHWFQGPILALFLFITIGAGFSLMFNLFIWCGKRWPKTTLLVGWILLGLFPRR